MCPGAGQRRYRSRLKASVPGSARDDIAFLLPIFSYSSQKTTMTMQLNCMNVLKTLNVPGEGKEKSTHMVAKQQESMLSELQRPEVRNPGVGRVGSACRL